MKLNCDLGESFGIWKMGHDAEIMPYLDQANIACGFHAGDPWIMSSTLALASQLNVSIGAHPAYPDLQGFGRRSMKMAAGELKSIIIYQISALDGLARQYGESVQYVKPHGALYNDMMQSEIIRQTVFSAVKSYSDNIPLMIQATPFLAQHLREAQECGVPIITEAFADRLYADNGLLISRQHPLGVHQYENAIEQISLLVHQQCVTGESGQRIPIIADSICLHSDTPFAAKLAASARRIINGENHP